MSSWWTVGLFVLVVACIPWLLKWVQQRYRIGLPLRVQGQPQVVSAVSLGPGHRLVVVDVGPDSARERLTLGVSGQGIACLHRFPAPNPPPVAQANP